MLLGTTFLSNDSVSTILVGSLSSNKRLAEAFACECNSSTLPKQCDECRVELHAYGARVAGSNPADPIFIKPQGRSLKAKRGKTFLSILVVTFLSLNLFRFNFGRPWRMPSGTTLSRRFHAESSISTVTAWDSPLNHWPRSWKLLPLRISVTNAGMELHYR